MSRELLRQALDALCPGRDALYNEARIYHQTMADYRPNEHARRYAELASVNATIEAIRAELAKPEPDEFTDYWQARWMETPALRAEFKLTSVQEIARQAFEAGRSLAAPQPLPDIAQAVADERER